MTAKIYQINFSCIGLMVTHSKQQKVTTLQYIHNTNAITQYTVKVHKKVKHVASMLHTHGRTHYTRFINNLTKVEP